MALWKQIIQGSLAFLFLAAAGCATTNVEEKPSADESNASRPANLDASEAAREEPSPAMAEDTHKLEPVLGNDEMFVKEKQEMLIFLGYLSGIPDGIAGPKTEEAVKKFQGDYGLEKTGEFDAQTDSLLGKASGMKYSSRPE